MLRQGKSFHTLMLSFSIKRFCKLYRHLLSLLLFVIISITICKAQKFLPDTLFVEFHGDSLIDMGPVNIMEINDTRKENPNFVRFETRNKYLLIPVDYEIYTKQPLSSGIFSGISRDTSRKYNYVLDIRKFEIETKKRRFSKQVYLVADIPVYEHIDDTNHYLGTLYYDYLYLPQAKKESPSKSTENLLTRWHTDFKIDLLTIESVSSGTTPDITPNFISDPKIKSLYLNTIGGTFIGLDWWGVQGEVYFTRPETDTRNHYASGIIRYQNNPDYESFALGKSSEHYTLRRNRNLILDADLNILLGFCKWKDIEIHNPTLYQLFDMELSSVQSIVYNPLNARGIIVRIGVIENLSYVINKKLKLQAGLFLGLGFKL